MYFFEGQYRSLFMTAHVWFAYGFAYNICLLSEAISDSFEDSYWSLLRSNIGLF